MRYLIRPAVFVPTTLSIIAVVASVVVSWWFLASIPFIWLGAICASPNLNLADGFLAYVAMILGALVGLVFKPLGEAILVGIISGYSLSVVEKSVRARPINHEDQGES